MNCRPSPTFPPSPCLTNPNSVSKIPPGSGLIVIAERSAILRVRGVGASLNARSHAVATSMLKDHSRGASDSWPLSDEFARQAVEIPRGKWRDRFIAGVETALRVLGPYRVTLRALAPIMVGDVEEGVFARSTAFSRVRVQAVFEDAVVGSTDAPQRGLAEAMGRLLYLVHVGIILWWLLDRSPSQRATSALVALLRRMLPSASLTLRLSPVRGFVQSADALFKEALLENAGSTD